MVESETSLQIQRSQQQYLVEISELISGTTDSSITATATNSVPVFSEAKLVAQSGPTQTGEQPELTSNDFSRTVAGYIISNNNSSETATSSSETLTDTIKDAFILTTNHISDTVITSENHTTSAQVFESHHDSEIEIDPVLFDRNLNLSSDSKNNSDKSTKSADFSLKTSNTCENIRLLQQQIDDSTISADQRLYLKQQQQNSQSSPIGDSQTNADTSSRPGYQLRALSEDISALEADPWIRVPAVPQIHVSSLSNELVNETLNYFVNCGQRLSQMTKTYDDNDAYLLLLQEKEVDLELAARIGQDLLKQNKQLKDSIKILEDELVKRQEDVQQLKHELASKVSLLDTFIQEEEHQTSLAESEDELTLKQPDHVSIKPTASSYQLQHLLPSSATLTDNTDNDGQSGFLSLNYNNQKSPSTLVEPFSSLPYNLNDTLASESRQQLTREDSTSSFGDEINHCGSKSNDQQELVQTVTFQLVESNKRLCELQDELFYKGEQNLMLQEKLFHLQEQLSESDRRLDDVASENVSLQKSVRDSEESQRELCDELKICKRNFNELLNVFLELQKESRIYRTRNLQENSNVNYFGELDPVNDINNISFDSFNNTSMDTQVGNHCEISNNKDNKQNSFRQFNNRMPTSSSLLEELKESMHKERDENFDTDATDEGDSGVHTANASSSVSPANDGSDDTDSDDPSSSDLRNKKNWLGFSTFMLTTLFILCLSVTLTSPSNFNLAQKLQNKLDR